MYMVLICSPADEKIKRVGQRMFRAQNDQFMNIYCLETEKPYGYILIDNKPETMTGHQVLSNIFGKTLIRCYLRGGRTNTHGSIAQTKKNILYSFFTIEAPCYYLYFYEVSFVQHKNFFR